MASHARSRRKVTAIAVPAALTAMMAAALAAAPALAASPTTAPSLPFPTVCPSGQTPAGTASPSASSSTASPSPSASKSGTATPSTSPSTTPTGTTAAGNAGPTPSAGASGSGSASPSPSPSSTGGFFGWLNGVWTWIVGDAQYVGHNGVVDAAAPLDRGGSTVVDAGAALGAKQDSGTSADASPNPDCISSASAAALAKKAAASGTSEGVDAGTIPWVMKTPDLSLYDLTYNGVKTVSVWNASAGKYVDEQVLDFTSSKVTITSMVTYSIQGDKTVYNNAGDGTTTTLIDAHLMTVSLSGSLFGLVPQTYTPSNPPPLPVGLTVPLIPVVFTGVTTQLAFLNTGTISVPGFDGFAQSGVAEPE